MMKTARVCITAQQLLDNPTLMPIYVTTEKDTSNYTIVKAQILGDRIELRVIDEIVKGACWHLYVESTRRFFIA